MTISHAPANLVGMALWVFGTASALSLSMAVPSVPSGPIRAFVAQVPAPTTAGPTNAIAVSVAIAVIGLLTQALNGFFADRKSKRDSDSKFAAQALEMEKVQIKQAYGDAERERMKAELESSKARAAIVADDLERAKKEAADAAATIARNLEYARHKKHEDMEKLNRLMMSLNLGYMELVRVNATNAPALKAILDKLQMDLPTVTAIDIPPADFTPILPAVPHNPPPAAP